MTTNTPNIDEQSSDFDAQVLKEEIDTDESKSPSVNVRTDYERSKEFSTPDHELSPEEISPSLGSSFNSINSESASSAEGNPENFLHMAQDIKPDSDQEANK